MAATRHSCIELTVNCYTDPVLFDVAGAMNSLLDFSSGQSGANGRAGKGALIGSLIPRDRASVARG